MTNRKLSAVFGAPKPIIGMLHLRGDGSEDRLENAKREIDILYGCGVDAVLAENYFGSTKDVEAVLAYLQEAYPDRIYGVNILGNEDLAFALARKYGADFLQIDSVCGHLPPKEDAVFAEKLARLREEAEVLVLGGVRFKYQPYLSGRTLQEDLALGMQRCDAIVVTGSGTGIATKMDKILSFREIQKDFPLIVGAGLTSDTCREQLSCADGAIVGSWFKEGGSAYNRIDAARVKCFMEKVNALRCP